MRNENIFYLSIFFFYLIGSSQNNLVFNKKELSDKTILIAEIAEQLLDKNDTITNVDWFKYSSQDESNNDNKLKVDEIKIDGKMIIDEMKKEWAKQMGTEVPPPPLPPSKND